MQCYFNKSLNIVKTQKKLIFNAQLKELQGTFLRPVQTMTTYFTFTIL